ncbi:TPA-induced transmembrane protein [Liparis tanakae]|uniref:TPA-induced transmembrane protein n=1 Tax=Liparis tanakae TaxID=230148 RepID=A0A4Z2HSY2_9TELE|nr:TPA-induced transmembrane protein [Liparis tanakae]
MDVEMQVIRRNGSDGAAPACNERVTAGNGGGVACRIPDATENHSLLSEQVSPQLADLYTTSPALGRYFSGVEIHAFRNGSVVADYQLTFLMPEEQQDQLSNVTLSREMVYNVFRQFLHDQEADESGQMYVEPASLNMFLRH